jgi:hypothetical protein
MALDRYDGSNGSGSSSTASEQIVDHIADTVDAHDASAISVTPAGSLASTDVQAALVELQTDITSLDTLKAPKASPTFTGVVSIPDGTAAAPSLKVGDEQNGLYSPAANQLSMTLNGTAKYNYTGETNYTVMGINASADAWGGAVTPVSVLRVGATGAAWSTTSTFQLGQNVHYNTSYNLVYRANGTAAYISLSGGQVNFYGAVSGTAGDTATFSNPLMIDGGNNLVSLLCGQLKFPATQNASSDANTLDDYEEGTWTPTITSQTGSITSTTLTAATYTKVGRKVTASVSLTITNAGTGTGSLLITIPHTAMAQACVGSGYEGALTGNALWALVGASDNKIQVRNYNNTTCIGTNAQIIVTVTYFV